MFNERPYYVNTEDYLPGLRQHLYYKPQGRIKVWATFNDLSSRSHNSRTNGKNDPECPEDGENWQPPTKITCLDDQDPVTTTQPKTTSQSSTTTTKTTTQTTAKPKARVSK